MSTPHGGFTSCMFTTVDVKLNGDNYTEWSATVRMIFLALELIEHIDGTSPSPTISAPSASDSPIAPSATTWRAADHRAMALIAQSVEVSIRMKIVDLPTAQEMWNHIRHLYEKKQFHRVQNSNSVMSQSMMDSRVISAARSGNIAQLQDLYADNYNLLNSSSTPYGNTALHLAVIYRQEEFAKELCSKCPSLLSAANADGNTPLLLAAAAGLQPIVTFAPKEGRHRGDVEEGRPRGDVGSNVEEGRHRGDVEEGNHKLRATNKMGNNALHEAVRNGHGEVALVLLRAEPELARQVNNNGESPLYMACYRGLESVVKELLQWPTASHEGPNGETALHAAVMVAHSAIKVHKNKPGQRYIKKFLKRGVEELRQLPTASREGPNGEKAMHAAVRASVSGLVKALLKERPGLVYVQDGNGRTPLHYASRLHKLAVVKLLLELDASLAYAVDEDGDSPITWAVKEGYYVGRSSYVPIFQEFVRCCPDSALMASKDGNTVLHVAVDNGSVEVVKYILRTPELKGLINQPNNAGDIPFQIAARRVNQPSIAGDVTLRRRYEKIIEALEGCQSLNALAVNHRGESAFDVNISHQESDLRSLQGIDIETFRNCINNSLVVATLIATVTFAAVFSVPGGYDGNQGLPVLVRKAAFKIFLISDAIAMCASLYVAFLCISTPWVHDELVEGYMDDTSAFLALGFEAMSVAFAMGLYVVVAPDSLWLAVIICVLCYGLLYLTIISAGPSSYFSLRKQGKIFKKIITYVMS